MENASTKVITGNHHENHVVHLVHVHITIKNIKVKLTKLGVNLNTFKTKPAKYIMYGNLSNSEGCSISVFVQMNEIDVYCPSMSSCLLNCSPSNSLAVLLSTARVISAATQTALEFLRNCKSGNYYTGEYILQLSVLLSTINVKLVFK